MMLRVYNKAKQAGNLSKCIASYNADLASLINARVPTQK
jgi:hypothetical protein